MKVQVIGIGQRRSGTSKTSGKQYDGTTIYCIGEANDVVGQKTEEVYFNHLSNITFPEIHVGDIIHVGYNRNGFMEEIRVEATGKAPQNQNLKINNQQ